jgi:hypothetical protein
MMKYKFNFSLGIKLGLGLCLLANPFAKAQSDKIPLQIVLNYDVAKSINHWSFKGYSYDPEILVIFPNRMVVGAGWGTTDFYREKLPDQNIIEYHMKGQYWKAQIGYLLPTRNDKTAWLITLGYVHSKGDESLMPYIPGSYFGNYYGPELKRENLKSSGGQLQTQLWFFPKSRVSFMLSSRVAWMSFPQKPVNPYTEHLDLKYLVGGGVGKGDVFVGLGVRVLVKLLPLKRE